jgi:small subunit ribosomal protein S20
MIDRLAKRGNIHRNKAANLKSGLMRHVNTLAA